MPATRCTCLWADLTRGSARRAVPDPFCAAARHVDDDPVERTLR